VAGLSGPRGLSGEALGGLLAQAGANHQVHGLVKEAWNAACSEATAADTILAFGSFYTVAELMTVTEAAPDTHG
jgi:dihydrofolate synthase/folylpolyglutamate synthase